jgi:BMFP domain-containing protein YqiC
MNDARNRYENMLDELAEKRRVSDALTARIAALEAQVSDDGKRIVALGEHNAVYQSARNVEFDARIAALEEALARLTGEAQS